MAARTPIPSGLRGGNPEGEAEEERVGETRVAEGATARGDGENAQRGLGALENRGGGSGRGGKKEEAGAKKGLDEGRSLGGGDWEDGAGGSSRRIGFGEGSWRWETESSVGIVCKGAQIWGRESGVGERAWRSGRGPVSRGLAWGRWKDIGVWAA